MILPRAVGEYSEQPGSCLSKTCPRQECRKLGAGHPALQTNPESLHARSLPRWLPSGQRNLGNLYFDEHQYEEALAAYQSAIDAGNDLLAEAYSEAGRQAEVSETAELYARAAYCLLQTNCLGDALMMLERGQNSSAQRSAGPWQP